jgi:hypothetical protein
VLGPDHPDTLWTMSNLAAIRRDLGDLKGAHDLHEQALAGLRRMLGDDHPHTLTTKERVSDLRLVLAARPAQRHDPRP